MTPQHRDIVVDTFAQVLKDRTRFGLAFYRRLFLMAPELRPLFETDVNLQAKKLVDMLAAGVASLSDMPALSATLRDLGERHVGYGVRSEHYLFVGVALIAMLEEALGPSFDKEAREAWTALYTLVSRAMKEGAARSRAPVAAGQFARA